MSSRGALHRVSLRGALRRSNPEALGSIFVRHEIAAAALPGRLAMTPGSHCEERCDEAIPRPSQACKPRYVHYEVAGCCWRRVQRHNDRDFDVIAAAAPDLVLVRL
jgi:hypothetical protein